ncbi:AAC(3) family N-acetyltransferase [Bradyrhizobium betae]|uniref:Aminoglycoside N(3)-acetyltransferase n=1 Tax=Bradyrhizobium betae TaxID=244734 RepID=A0A5P6PBY3_9BRAD|nr:AAC(3) family N-acetyltransferase [Bradyrhizobium betae]MCS3726380.1 aminoglycoside N3'-acetyltransferase [Bradyrhizobium betae]QFI75608.1 AAC(3) family N-acetyltransferase [Bradyrhizobium betae]
MTLQAKTDDEGAILNIAADLVKLGLRRDDTVLVRCATKSMTVQVANRPGALLDGIRRVIGPGGTIVALAFTDDFYFWQRKRALQSPFHAKAPAGTGALPQMLLDNPLSIRSLHPTNSFVALGPNARLIVEGHNEKSTSFYPIEKLMQLGGKLALIGCVESSPGFSTVHRVQEDLGLADRTLLSGLRLCAVRQEKSYRWFFRRDIPGCSAGFGKFYSEYEQEGILSRGSVGGALSMLADAAAAYRVERRILEKDPTAAFCDDPSCTSCGMRTYSPNRMRRFFLSLPKKAANRVAAKFR